MYVSPKLKEISMTYREAKNHVAEHVLNPQVARRVILMLYRWSGGHRDIRLAFLERIVAQVNESKTARGAR
jgi:hypothetical protein